jgi:hypothetical protein
MAESDGHGIRLPIMTNSRTERKRKTPGESGWGVTQSAASISAADYQREDQSKDECPYASQPQDDEDN